MDNKICTRCVMDSEATIIDFDPKGVCNYCRQFDLLCKNFPDSEGLDSKLQLILNSIRKHNKNRKYNCVIGVSGGTDSTYLLYLAKKWNLRPLVVHFDNGWNSEIAVQNIHKAMKFTGFDLETYVVNWEDFKDIQISFLKASVPEAEIPTDFGIYGILYKLASHQNIKYILLGESFREEGIVPFNWAYSDNKYVTSIQKTFSKKELKTYPFLPPWKKAYYLFWKRIIVIRPLNYVHYHKEEAKKILSKAMGWVDYGGHHHESIYSRFYISWLAPVKFKMDRRKVNLSAKIRLNKISRELALEELKKPILPSVMIENDKYYVAKKLGMTIEEFEKIILLPALTFMDYPNYFKINTFFRKWIQKIYNSSFFPKKWIMGKFSK